MQDQVVSPAPTASSLKKELAESLAQLQKDFQALQRFVTELASDEVSEHVRLPREDVRDLIVTTEAIHDAASDIVFEAQKVKETLRHSIQ